MKIVLNVLARDLRPTLYNSLSKEADKFCDFGYTAREELPLFSILIHFMILTYC